MEFDVEEFLIQYWKDIKMPDIQLSKRKFEHEASRKFAARDILTYVRFHTDIPKIAVIEEYSAKMYEYSKIINPGCDVFKIAYDTAEDILYRLKVEKRKRDDMYYYHLAY